MESTCRSADVQQPEAQGEQANGRFVAADDPSWASDEYRMYRYKVELCPMNCIQQDWGKCCYAHIGEKARRRDLSLGYSSTACPDMLQSGKCSRGDACTMAHSPFEFWLHPERYKTETCKDGDSCNRPVCFFAHNEEERRTTSIPRIDAAGNPFARAKFSMSCTSAPKARRRPDAAAACSEQKEAGNRRMLAGSSGAGTQIGSVCSGVSGAPRPMQQHMQPRSYHRYQQQQQQQQQCGYQAHSYQQHQHGYSIAAAAGSAVLAMPMQHSGNTCGSSSSSSSSSTPYSFQAPAGINSGSCGMAYQYKVVAAPAGVANGALLCPTPAEQAVLLQQRALLDHQQGLMPALSPVCNAPAGMASASNSYMIGSCMTGTAGVAANGMQPVSYGQHLAAYNNAAVMMPAAAPESVMLQQQCAGSLSTQSSMCSSSSSNSPEVAFYGNAATAVPMYTAAPSSDTLLVPVSTAGYGMVCGTSPGNTLMQQQQQPVVMAVPAAAGYSYVQHMNQPAVVHMPSQGLVVQQQALVPWVVQG